MSMALLSRVRSSVGAGAIAILILVLAFGNQAYAEWADKHATGANAWDLLLRTLSWPRWFVTSGSQPSRAVLAYDLRALLLVLFVVAIVGLARTSVAGGFGGLVLGWFAVIFGGAIAALITSFLTTDSSFYNALGSALQAAGYGLIVGWLVGLFVAINRSSETVTAAA
jgi:hypothetical protein